MSRKLIIIGAGGHGRSVEDAAIAMGSWNEIVFVDDQLPEKFEQYAHKIIGTTRQLFENRLLHDEGTIECIVAIGDNRARTTLSTKLVSEGFTLVNVIHPRASVSPSAQLEKGCAVLAGAVVGSHASLGMAGIVNCLASVNHDCNLGKGVHISPNGAVGGGAFIEDYTWVGISASVIHGIHIGSDVVVGAGAAVVSDIGNNQTVVGIPARDVSASQVLNRKLPKSRWEDRQQANTKF